MRRRKFITLLGGAAAWPLAARAQQGKLPTIGFLGSGTAATQSQWTAAFVRRLRELGWSEGRNVAIEYRWAEGRNERAAEIVRLKVEVIVTYGTQSIFAAKQATTIILIVFALPGDPVATGLVASLARPGGNVTGLSTQHDDSAGKRLELLHEVVPHIRRLAIIGNTGNSGVALEMRAVQAAAYTLGLDVITVKIQRAEDIAPGVEALKGHAEALYVAGDALVNTNRDRINATALETRLPTIHGFREIVVAGGLMSYAPNYLAVC